MINIQNSKMLNEKETIELLEANGIQVVSRPVALMPDNLESYQGIRGTPICTIETDIYIALNRLKIINKVIGDPFSK